MKKVLFAGLLTIMGVSVNAQNLIKNPNFATEVATKVTNPNRATSGEWFVLNNEKEGATTIAWEKNASDTQYPNAVKFDNSGADANISWYKAFLGQRMTDGLDKGVYALTFYVKAKDAGTPVAVYIKQTNEDKGADGKANTTFFMRRDYDQDAQPNASGAQYNFKVKDAGKWTKVVVYYDMGQLVNTISSKKSNSALEIIDTPDGAAILKDCYIAVMAPEKGSVLEISDVTLKKK